MGLFGKLFNKKSEPTFSKVKEEIRTLENQDGRIENPTKEDLRDYLNCLFNEDDQFVTLTLAKAQNSIRYIQACFVDAKPIVQLGLEENDKTRLVEKTCLSNEECADIFFEFYDYGIVENLEEYQPVQF